MKGTALFTIFESSSSLVLIWQIENYPMETAEMPGSPYPVLVRYTLLNKKKLKSHTGNFIFEINSGTLQNYSKFGIPYGTYNSVAYSNNNGFEKKISLILTEETSNLIVADYFI
jgi:hypothetical protein